MVAVVITALGAGYAFTDLPERLGAPRITIRSVASGPADEHRGHRVQEEPGGHQGHAGHDHESHGDHSDHENADSADKPSDENSLSLSDEARANLNLQVAPVDLGTFTRYLEVPALVTPWPGRTHVAVTSPLTGVIHSIDVGRGELIPSGRRLFTLRLTHQDLVNTQEQFLSQLGQLDVEEKEIERLASIASTGAIAGKSRLARQYERDKLLASIRAARQAMLLHGLSEDQILGIERTRQLVREITVTAPEVHLDDSLHHDSLGDAALRMAGQPSAQVASMVSAPPAPVIQPPRAEHPPHLDMEFLVSELSVHRGQAVRAGDPLARLSDYSELLIEGHSYQRDGKALQRAAQSSTPLKAVIDTSGQDPEIIDGLKIVSIGNEVGRDSRTLPFYVALENRIERSETRDEDRYVSWQYKPGQRLTLRLPVETQSGVIVVPKNAVAREGPERYVFVENGDHFERVRVRVVSQDALQVAIAAGGQLWPGQAIVTEGAHQLQMAFKNRGGGAIDPHAGHHH